MSRASTSVRRACRAATGVLAAGLTLAACGTTAGTAYVVGFPSRSISVPLRVVACTTSNSCVAVGTSGSDVGPSSVGEFRRPNGQWTPLYVPAAPSSLVTTSACWDSACLIGGTQPTGDLLWAYDATTRTVTTLATPHAGQGVSALSCFASESCAVIDSLGVAEGARISFTIDGGASWTTPLSMSWSIGDPVTAVSCADALNCLVAATAAGGRALVEVTLDGGVTWTVRPTSPTWNSLSSLSCTGLRCVGLASTSSGAVVERTQTFARTWSSVALNQRANALACTSYTKCVVVGQTKSNNPWFATLRHRALHVEPLKYVPTPLTSAACGAKVCVAIGVSTVLALRP
jgi:hypothetical protein